MAEREWYRDLAFELVLPGLSDEEIDDLADRKGWCMHPDFRLYLRYVNGGIWRRADRYLAVRNPKIMWLKGERERESREYPDVDFYNWPPQAGKRVISGAIRTLWELDGVGEHEDFFSLDDPRRDDFWLERQRVVGIGRLEPGCTVLIDLREGPSNGRIYIMDRDIRALAETEVQFYQNGLEGLLDEYAYALRLSDFFSRHCRAGANSCLAPMMSMEGNSGLPRALPFRSIRLG